MKKLVITLSIIVIIIAGVYFWKNYNLFSSTDLLGIYPAPWIYYNGIQSGLGINSPVCNKEFERYTFFPKENNQTNFSRQINFIICSVQYNSAESLFTAMKHKPPDPNYSYYDKAMMYYNSLTYKAIKSSRFGIPGIKVIVYSNKIEEAYQEIYIKNNTAILISANPEYKDDIDNLFRYFILKKVSTN